MLLSCCRRYYDVDRDPARSDDGYKTKYWVVPKADNVRPYGILMRELSPLPPGGGDSDDY